MALSTEKSKLVGDFVHQQLLIATKKLIETYKLGNQSVDFANAQYLFLWYTSLANTNALEAAYDLMCEDHSYLNMPIDSIAIFGRVFAVALAPSNPEKAKAAFETLIKINADPGESDHVEEIISKALKT